MYTQIILVGVLEHDARQRSTSTGVVNDLLHQTLDVTMVLGVIKSAVAGGTLSVLVV